MALAVAAAVIMRTGALPRGIGRLGAVMRLTVLDADSAAMVVPAALAGLLASPAVYTWLGLELRRMS